MDLLGTLAGMDLLGTLAGMDLLVALAGMDLLGTLAGMDILGTLAGMDLLGTLSGMDLLGILAGMDLLGTLAGMDLLGTLAGMDLLGTLAGMDLLVALAGMRCTSCIQDNDRAKNLILMVAGDMSFLDFICVFIPVSWMAHGIIRDFYNPPAKHPAHTAEGEALHRLGHREPSSCPRGSSLSVAVSPPTKPCWVSSTQPTRSTNPP
ncbi:claudin-3-like [Oncorhynchus tshawytscha]|uniref:claudin-3-like n=1 Tax=Oncorhynchus tshawytscha TaxID=74940 RepID=UPI001C3C9F3D|nr:claudin-3-like [Oncorhynchus tshawytscha]